MTSSPPPSQTSSAAAASVGGQPTGPALALGRIPSGLFVVAWRDGAIDRVMLASWVMQSGFTPPSITIAVAPGRDLLAAVKGGAVFVVNVLAEGQRQLLARFGKPAAGDDPFAGLAIERAACGAVKLAGAAAWLECRPVAVPAGEAVGDHVVVVAEVIAGGACSDTPPLVHVRKNGLRY